MGDPKDTFLLERRSSNSDYKDIKGGNVRIKKREKESIPIVVDHEVSHFSRQVLSLPRHNVFLLLVIYSLEKNFGKLRWELKSYYRQQA
jgi:hypothetical protein